MIVTGEALPCGPEIWSVCTEEYGPCENHGVTLAQREGASLRTGDELCALFVLDVDALRQAEGLAPMPLSANDRALLGSVDGWLDDDDERDAVHEMAQEAESSLPFGCVAYWEDGYVISRVTGGPLLD